MVAENISFKLKSILLRDFSIFKKAGKITGFHAGGHAGIA